MTDAMRTGGASPPGDRSGPRAVYYLEGAHYPEADDARRARIVRTVVRCLGRDASRYRAWFVGQGQPRRGEALPEAADGREALLDDVLAWFGTARAHAWDRGALLLYDGPAVLLDASEGLPGIPVLTSGQFAALQACLVRAGLPADLYYPETQTHWAIEPVRRWGGVVLARVPYSPAARARRDATSLGEMRPPSEADRARAFSAACARFARVTDGRLRAVRAAGVAEDSEEVRDLKAILRLAGQFAPPPWETGETPPAPLYDAGVPFIMALNLRQAELTEPGKHPDEAVLEELATLHRLTSHALRRARSAQGKEGQ
jgi:hypothetical protein